MRLTPRGERLIELTLGTIVVGMFVLALGFMGWIEGGALW